MVDYEKKRKEVMEQFGFGPDVMKQSKVCRICHVSCAATEEYCHECGALLPRETLYDLYKSNHLYCTACETVVADTVLFCPTCGKRLWK